MNEQIKELVELGNGIHNPSLEEIREMLHQSFLRMEAANNKPSLYYTYSRKEKQQ